MRATLRPKRLGVEVQYRNYTFITNFYKKNKLSFANLHYVEQDHSLRERLVACSRHFRIFLISKLLLKLELLYIEIFEPSCSTSENLD